MPFIFYYYEFNLPYCISQRSRFFGNFCMLSICELGVS
uniref:Uncharacterized protein n=1 Tax=Anguilla anguilla TaxID=7936 RepID=A0A0E9Q130_ANGAN